MPRSLPSHFVCCPHSPAHPAPRSKLAPAFALVVRSRALAPCDPTDQSCCRGRSCCPLRPAMAAPATLARAPAVLPTSYCPSRFPPRPRPSPPATPLLHAIARCAGALPPASVGLFSFPLPPLSPSLGGCFFFARLPLLVRRVCPRIGLHRLAAVFRMRPPSAQSSHYFPAPYRPALAQPRPRPLCRACAPCSSLHGADCHCLGRVNHSPRPPVLFHHGPDLCTHVPGCGVCHWGAARLARGCHATLRLSHFGCGAVLLTTPMLCYCCALGHRFRDAALGTTTASSLLLVCSLLSPRGFAPIGPRQPLPCLCCRRFCYRSPAAPRSTHPSALAACQRRLLTLTLLPPFCFCSHLAPRPCCPPLILICVQPMCLGHICPPLLFCASVGPRRCRPLCLPSPPLLRGPPREGYFCCPRCGSGGGGGGFPAPLFCGPRCLNA